MIHEQGEKVNEDRRPRRQAQEAELLEKAAEVARGYGLEWDLLEAEPAPNGRRPDAFVHVGTGVRKLRLVVEVKTNLRPGQAGAILAQLEPFQLPGLLVTDFVNPNLAEELQRLGLFFIDAVGNAFLRHDGILLWVTGKRPTQQETIAKEKGRAFQPTGLKLIFTLLRNPELVEQDYRTLAAEADVALGTVGWVLRDLQEQGYLIRKGKTERRLVDLDKLLDEWALGYARDLAPRCLLGKYETGAFETWRQVDLKRHHAEWGREAAAALMTNYLKPETLTLWVAKLPPRLLADLHLRADEAGRVEIRQRFWRQERVQGAPMAPKFDEAVTRGDVAPMVLVYAELLAQGDARTIETAKLIRELWIDGPFKHYRAQAAR
jgi:hypothetical protein